MLKVKLSRTGKRNQPHFRIVITEAQNRPGGNNVEVIGHYTPTKHEFKIDIKKYRKWIEQGAQPTRTVKNLVKKHS